MLDSETSARPLFGEPLPIRASRETLAFLERRRSASAMTLTAPGPGPEALAELLTVAARAPDHGKLSPWRFVVLRGEAKAAFVAGLERIAAGQPNATKAIAKLGKIRTPPVTVAVISRVVEGEIPEWEQVLSAGAVCTLMVVGRPGHGLWRQLDHRLVRLRSRRPEPAGRRDGRTGGGAISISERRQWRRWNGSGRTWIR